ncbi:glycosyltransferase [Algoriphagus sp. 4150]|uniref:glycosyltransferase family 2 protein n=1 Tax=Algoriphagus sp. 4150 TaxID=2817756 RepID=UPI00286CCCF3|nr:glycosyltransferase [Algoriphagus sp. 4150]
MVLPIYKGEKYLKEAIQSILDQSYSHFELILVNDASPDDSKSVIGLFDDERIRYIENEVNLGLIGSLNRGLDAAQGKYIARMDQDDISLPERFSKQVIFLEKNPKVVICGMQGLVLGTEQKIELPEKDFQIRTFLFFGSPFIHPVVMIRRDTLIQNDLKYDMKYFHAEDFGLWVNLSFKGELANLKDVGILYRKHDLQYTKVFVEGNKNSSFNAKTEYLDHLGIKINKDQENIYLKIFKREIDKSSSEEMKRVASFFMVFYQKVIKLGFDKIYLSRFLYRKWKVICSDRQKEGVFSYLIFLKGPFVFRFFEPKVHLWFIKKQIGL